MGYFGYIHPEAYYMCIAKETKLCMRYHHSLFIDKLQEHYQNNFLSKKKLDTNSVS